MPFGCCMDVGLYFVSLFVKLFTYASNVYFSCTICSSYTYISLYIHGKYKNARQHGMTFLSRLFQFFLRLIILVISFTRLLRFAHFHTHILSIFLFYAHYFACEILKKIKGEITENECYFELKRKNPWKKC